MLFHLERKTSFPIRSSRQRSTRQMGVLILSEETGKNLKEWEPISERIIIARFESKCQNTTITQVYAPTNDAEEEEKEDFFH